jgi:hypothetical protein
MEWMVIWGATQAAGFIFKPILEDLAKESAKDYAKDFFKDCLKKVIRLPEPDVLKEVYGKALKIFLELIQDELQGAGYQEAIIKQYVPFLKKFIDREEVAAALGMAYSELKLWKIFIPQNLRECQEFIPQVYELPKDRWRLLQESG